MKTAKRIRTVLYGDQRLSSAELEILHTPAMQRLYGLRQLGLTDRVFIDASHARIHHVVGVLQQVEKLVCAIVGNLRRTDRTLRIGAVNSEQETFSAKNLADFVDERKPVVRLIGLLHDLTHAPFGHTVEDEIQLVESKHDEPARQADALYRLLCQLVVWLTVEANGPTVGLPESLKPFTSQAASAQLPEAAEVGAAAHTLVADPNPSRFRLCWRLSQDEVAEMFAHLGCAMTTLAS
jgi:dGTP triphosphohydrolase